MSDEKTALEAARRGDERAFAVLIEPYRRGLRAHCYRMSGSLHDADDFLQESLLRIWRGLGSFEGRSSLRTWLFKVTTSVCLDELRAKRSRLLPMDFGPAVSGSTPFSAPRLEPVWLEPWPDGESGLVPSPQALYTSRESVTLAFLVALQLLPPKQRAILLLRDVLEWQASECADLLDLSVAAVNSALQRARETIAQRAPRLHDAPLSATDEKTVGLLARYVAAWETSDVATLVSLLHEDATLVMPPLSQWLQGAHDIGASLSAMILTPGSSGAFRLVPTRANGLPTFAIYQRDNTTGEHRALSIQLVEIVGERIASISAFLDPSLFSLFGLSGTLQRASD